MSKSELHEFYCTKCGHKGIPVMRRISLKKEKFHKKKLYCIYCKEEVNHVEIKNFYEAEEFKIDFSNGVYA